jgi:hypothetical protein
MNVLLTRDPAGVEAGHSLEEDMQQLVGDLESLLGEVQAALLQLESFGSRCRRALTGPEPPGRETARAALPPRAAALDVTATEARLQTQLGILWAQREEMLARLTTLVPPALPPLRS